MVILTHRATGRVFPLWVDDKDAASISRGAAPRSPAGEPPLDAGSLLSAVIDVVGVRVEHAALIGMVGGVVRARVALLFGDERHELPARASDAVALAARVGAPILVDDGLLEHVAARVREAEARLSPSHAAAAEPIFQTPGERWNQLLEHLSGGPEGPIYEA